MTARIRGVAMATVLLLALQGCRSSNPSGNEHIAEHVKAHGLCAAAFPKVKKLANWDFTTVGAVRSLKGGPNAHLAADAFPGVDPNAFAAWCWLGNGPNRWNGYAVTAGQPPYFVAPQDGSSIPPFGPPVVP